MHQDGQHQRALDLIGAILVAFAQNALAGAGLALDHRVNGFQVTWVGRKTDTDLTIRQLATTFVTEVILHIAVTCHRIGLVIGGEFVENGGQRFAHKVGEHVHAAAVRHAHLNFLHPVGRTGFENGIEKDHRAFTALIGETLLTQKALAEEVLKSLRFQNPLQRLTRDIMGIGYGAAHTVFNACSHPVTHLRVVNVHELETDVRTVGFFEGGDDIAQGHAFAIAEVFIPGDAIHVGLTQTELVQSETRIALRLILERIDMSLSMTEGAVVIDQCHHPCEETDVLAVVGRSCLSRRQSCNSGWACRRRRCGRRSRSILLG